MPTITFLREEKTVEVEEGTNLREAAREAGIDIHTGPHKIFNCFGNGLCGSCGVLVKEGQENCSQKGFLEKLRLMFSVFALGREEEGRLSCQVTVEGDMAIWTNPLWTQLNAHVHGEAKTYYDKRLNNEEVMEFPEHPPRQYWEEQPTVPIRFDQEREKFLQERKEKKQEKGTEEEQEEG